MRVGIALAVYRPKAGFLIRQLESIEKQTYPHWICVVTCDSPMDALFENPGLLPFKRHPKFRWHQNEKRLGCRDNFGRAVRLCLEEGVQAVACSDQDDVWYPEKVGRCVEELRLHPPLSLVHSDMRVLVTRGAGEERLPETLWQIEARGVERNDPIHFLIRDTASGASMLFDAELIRLHPAIPDEFEFHDAWYAFLASAYGGVYPIREPLYDFRQHGRNVLGMTPFRGVFHPGPGARWTDVLSKCRRKYLLSRAMAAAAIREKVPLPRRVSWMFLSRLDLGMGFFLLGVACSARRRTRDLPLARAAWARAAGKFLSLFARNPQVEFSGRAEKNKDRGSL